MVIPNANPDTCCGVQNSCCPDMKQTLTATIVTSCGTYTGSLTADDSNATYACWKGSVTFQCKQSPISNCSSKTMHILLCCAGGSGCGGFQITLDCAGSANTGMIDTGCTCSPLNLVSSHINPTDCGCYQTPTITITE